MIDRVLYTKSRDLIFRASRTVRAGLNTLTTNEMNSGSDSDSFDEGGLTARGRKSKRKSGARASEKSKQKAKDVRTRVPLMTSQSP